MVTKNLDTVLVDMKEAPLKKDDGERLTLKDAAITSLFGQYADEQNLGGEEKFKRFELAMRINTGGEQALSAEDIVLLKRLIGKAWGPLVVGQVYTVLND